MRTAFCPFAVKGVIDVMCGFSSRFAFYGKAFCVKALNKYLIEDLSSFPKSFQANAGI
jgi:hypothetical protein